VFCYKTKTATTALGDVILVTDYDAADGAPESSIQAESYQAYADCAPWQNQEMAASRQNLEKFPQRYTRDAAPPAGTDIKTYDVGSFYICTENQASAALVGYLYVEYTVELFTPQLRSADFYISGGLITGATSMTAANPLGTAPTASAATRGFAANTSSVLTINNPGTYLIAVAAQGTTLSAVTLTAVAGCTLGTPMTLGSVASAAATEMYRVRSVVVSSFGATVSLALTAATVTLCQVALSSLPVGSVALADDPEGFTFIEDWSPERIRELKDTIVETRDPVKREKLLLMLKSTLKPPLK
jgi:hypothetical protein